MLKVPMGISKNDLSFENGIICLRIDGEKYKMGPYFPYCNDAGDDSDKLKVLHYLLTSKHSEIKQLYDKDGFVYPNPTSMLKKVNVGHDPAPNCSLMIHPFNSLESIQWHLLVHGIADYWLQNKKIFLLSGIIPEDDMAYIWDNFVRNVRCKRWSIDLPHLRRFESKSKWESERDKLRSKHPGCHGCFHCIDEQGMEKFLKCCVFFEEYRNEFLKRIRRWIVDTIQDNDNIHLYRDAEDVLPDGATPARRHVHTISEGRGNLYAYVTERRSDGKVDIFIIIFKLFGTHSENVLKYSIKSSYGLETRRSEKKALSFIKENAKNWKEDARITNYCYKTNWNATNYVSGH